MEVKLQVQLHRDVVDRIATFKVLFEDLRSLFPDQYNHQHYDDLDFEATVSVYEIVKFLNCWRIASTLAVLSFSMGEYKI
mgnify:CR=1 FL=1